MVSYKTVLSKIIRSSSFNLPDDKPSPYRTTLPSRTLSFPSLPSAKFIHEEPSSIPSRAPRVLLRRPHSMNRRSAGSVRGFFTRFRSHSISIPGAIRPHTRLLATAPITEEGFVVCRALIPSSDDKPPPTYLAPVVPESCDIDLLLSNEPGDAKKAIIKRLEGLALALEDVASTTSVRTFQKTPSISFSDTPPPGAAVFESLSPIENWEDEDPVEGNGLSHIVDDSSSFSRSQSSSSDSCSSSSWISSMDEAKPPPTPCLIAAQYPISFHLEPIPQLTLDICKSTPSPVYPREISGHMGLLLPVESVVISWDDEQYPP